MVDILRLIGQILAAFKPGFASVCAWIGTVVCLLFIYKVVYFVVGFLCTRKFSDAQTKHRFGIVIPARNEKKVIANLLDSIEKQDYPKDKLAVFVIADNCTDDGETARIARENGAVVYERNDSEHVSKGFALQYLFQNIEKDYGIDSFEGFIVLDADNLLKGNYISKMNDAFDSGERIITSYKNSKNLDESWVSAVTSIHWLRSARLYHRARSVFHLSTNIQGTGYLFASEIVKDGWNYTSLTPDRELSADAVCRGYRVTYNDEAELYDEQPVKAKIAFRQRLRWAKGHLNAFIRYGGKLFKTMFAYKGEHLGRTLLQRFAAFDMLVLVFPRAILSVMISFTALVYACFTVYNKMFWAAFCVYFLLLRWLKHMSIATYVLVTERKRIKHMPMVDRLQAVVAWPIFDIVGKITMCIAPFKNVQWLPIPHNNSIRIEDIDEPDVHAVPKFLKHAGENGRLRFAAHCAFAALMLMYSVFMLDVHPGIFAMFAGVNILLIGLHILVDLKDDRPRWMTNVLVAAIFVWNIMMCCEVLGSGSVSYVFSLKLFINLFLYAMPYILLYTVFNSVQAASIVTALFWFVISSANMFLTDVRGRPLFLSDFYSIGTAINVAGQYTLSLTEFYICTFVYIVFMIAYFRVLVRTHEKEYYKYRWYKRYCVNIPILIVGLMLILSPNFMSFMGVTPYFWTHKVNGFPLNFVLDLQHSKMEEPDGYSLDELLKLQEQYPADDITINRYDSSMRPNVIVIMNESYSDLRYIGDFDTNIEVTPFMDRLCEDESVISGYIYSSVLGGGTADSEYEFLTGDSMFLYPQGAVPYQTNIKSGVYIPSIVTTFNSMGYKTVATHPYLASGWNRPVVYETMGFDVQQYQEDYENIRYIRKYVSDESDFENIIKLYEEKGENEPLFVFNVTMQNHGGYTTKYKNFDQKVELRNMSGDYPMAEQYLSLMHETDIALQMLIDYFEDVDEPTVIMFYGDHQSKIEDGFYEELYGKKLDDLTDAERMEQYVTRYFIWSNYDLNTPDAYENLTAMQGRIYDRLTGIEPDAATGKDENKEAGSNLETDKGADDITGSDGVDENDEGDDENENTFSPGTLGEIAPKPDGKIEHVYTDDSDSTDDNETDVNDSDAVGDDDDYVTQSRPELPQSVTSINHLSTILFEAAGLPLSTYQQYLLELRREYPVINCYGFIGNDGEFVSMDRDEWSIHEEFMLYEYVIYNRMFDSENTIKELTCFTENMVKLEGSFADKYLSELNDNDNTKPATVWGDRIYKLFSDFIKKKE